MRDYKGTPPLVWRLLSFPASGVVVGEGFWMVFVDHGVVAGLVNAMSLTFQIAAWLVMWGAHREGTRRGEYPKPLKLR
jgi:hypothetical protein